MSNSQVGGVYAAIIDEVLDMSRVDFEESGVSIDMMEELRKGWQERLTSMNIAQFPWDPKPEPPAPAVQQPVNNIGNAPTLAPAGQPIAPQYTQAQLSPPANGGGLPLPSLQQSLKPEPALARAEPPIKVEPGMPMPMPSFQPNTGGAAAERAAQALQSKFGAAAGASISAIRGGNPQPGQPPMPGQPQQRMMPQPGAPLPNGMQQQQAQQNYARPPQPGQMPMPAQQRMMPQPGAPNGQQIHQLDGTTDAVEGIVVQNGVEMGRVELDGMLHEKFAARAKQMEGGGLMLPLKQATKHRGVKAGKSNTVGAAQGDAMDDDEDEDVKPIADDELINSDLDDPDDNVDDDDDDDDGTYMMLCMYDKVQRVKNKWKCTLKDGVLSVQGKEYVFHKATGEYEW